MRIGLMSDIHGNLLALDAVIADGVACGVELWWVLGDLVAIGPDPLETLDRLVELPGVAFVRGNTDRYVVTGDRPPPWPEHVQADPSLLTLFGEVEASFSWTHGYLAGHHRIEWLSALPDSQTMVLPDGTRLLGIHASPSSDDGRGITPSAPEEDLAALLAGAEADLICGGHTHQPTDRVVGRVRAVNLGSVSNPITSDLRASYVIIDADRHGHEVQHRRVDYDHDAVIERVRRSGHPATDFIASFQTGDQVRHPAATLPTTSSPAR